MEQRKATLQDVLNYQADAYFTPEEMALIQSTFKDRRVMNVLRKALLPTVGDMNMPLEEMGNDVWLVGRDYSQISSEEIKPIVVARQEAIKFVMGGLIKLKIMANSGAENPQDKALRESKDSNK